MELVVGSISDRPWGLTLGALGTRGFTGVLTLASNKGKFHIRFCGGVVVDATSPLATDTALRIAVVSQLITPALAADIAPVFALRAEEGEDEVQVIGELGNLSDQQVIALRRRVIAQRAARTFTADRGEFTLEPDDRCRVTATSVDVHAVIYLGARVYLCQQRLIEELAQYGSRFACTATAGDALSRFGFTELEGPVLEGLREGASLEALEARHRDPRTVHAVVYALLACLACAPAPVEVVPPRPVTMPPRPRTTTPGYAMRFPRGTPSDAYDAPPPPQRLARGSDSGMAHPRTRTGSTVAPARTKTGSTPPPMTPGPTVSAEDRLALARNAFRRGQLALDDDSLDRALTELARAVELAPNEVDYQAMLAWARFRAASDKEAVADATRQVLGRAILKARAPEVARFILGRVERILGRDREALRHFTEVLELQPENREAASEVRVLEARLTRMR